MECCSNTSNTHICFYYYLKSSSSQVGNSVFPFNVFTIIKQTLPLRILSVPHELIFVQNYSCLPARSTSERPTCRLPSDCKMLSPSSVCVIPSLDSHTKLVKVYRTNKPPILFLGHPLDLHYSCRFFDFGFDT